ncbi:MAG: hypothetical protein H6618_01930 [Deltaproteobacteria bacterium]|nr:hypothetical protein [Deltaproteobacteria bacterium]
MFEIHRDCLQNKYHRLSVKHCPYDFIIEVAKLGDDIVTVENYSADANVDTPKVMNLGLKDKEIFEVSVRSLACNFDTSKNYFLKMLQGLDEPTFYAVFHKKPLKLTATTLDDIPRYRALDNFGWNLEISTPNNSIEYAFFASPDKDLIDKIEMLFK